MGSIRLSQSSEIPIHSPGLSVAGPSAPSPSPPVDVSHKTPVSNPLAFAPHGEKPISTLPDDAALAHMESSLDKTPSHTLLRRSGEIPPPQMLSESSASVSHPEPIASSSSAPPEPITDPATSKKRMGDASILRQQIQQINKNLENPSLPKELRDEANLRKADLEGRLTTLKQEIMGEIVTPEIRGMGNSPEKAQAVFQSFLSRGQELYKYQTTTSGMVDLLAGDTKAACGNIAMAFSKCLREAGFPSDDVRGNHKFDPGGGAAAFLTKPLDHDFIDASAIGNVRTGGGELADCKRYLFSQHYITRLEGVGFFCPTSGKFATTEKGLADQLVETTVKSSGTTYTGGGHTVDLVRGSKTDRGEGVYSWTQP